MWRCAITAVVGKNGLLSQGSNSFLSRHPPRDPIMGGARIFNFYDDRHWQPRTLPTSVVSGSPSGPLCPHTYSLGAGNNQYGILRWRLQTGYGWIAAHGRKHSAGQYDGVVRSV